MRTEFGMVAHPLLVPWQMFHQLMVLLTTLQSLAAVNGAGKGVAGLLFNDAVSTVVVFNFEFDNDIVTF